MLGNKYSPARSKIEGLALVANEVNRPRILFVGPFPPPYQGMTIANQAILDSMLRIEFDIRTINTSYGYLIGPSLAGDLLLKKSWSNIRRTWVVTQLLSEFQPDIVYLPLSQSPFGLLRNCIWILICKRFAHCIVHLHGASFRQVYDGLGWLARTLVSVSLHQVDAVIVLSEKFRPIFAGLVSDTRLHVVPNGIRLSSVSEEQFKATMQRRVSRGGQPLQILYLSNLFEAKGFGDLLRAVLILRNRGMSSDFRLSLAGAWESRKTMEKWMSFVTQHNLDGQVEFLGVVRGQAKLDLLLESDVCVLPTTYLPEGQPVSLIEAMAVGLPIISTDQGCIAEMVRDGVNGFIVPKHDSIAIANRLLDLLVNRDLRISMGQSSRAAYLERYTEDAFIGGLRTVFLSVLS